LSLAAQLAAPQEGLRSRSENWDMTLNDKLLSKSTPKNYNTFTTIYIEACSKRVQSIGQFGKKMSKTYKFAMIVHLVHILCFWTLPIILLLSNNTFLLDEDNGQCPKT
jgi:hypothetical protein